MIKQFEGCHKKGNDGRLYVYPDPLSGGEPYTVGWGSTRKHDGTPFHMGESISQSEADALLEFQLDENYWKVIEQSVPYWAEMNDNQRGALLSFAYNLGPHFMTSDGFPSMQRVLREKRWDQVPETMYKYRNPGSSVEEGLARRREAEGRLWST